MDRRTFVLASIAGAVGVNTSLFARRTGTGAALPQGAIAVADTQVPASLEFGQTAASTGARLLLWDDGFLSTWQRWGTRVGHGEPHALIAALLPSSKAHQLTLLSRDRFMYPLAWSTESEAQAAYSADRLVETAKLRLARTGHRTAQPPRLESEQAQLEFLLLGSMIQGVGK